MSVARRDSVTGGARVLSDPNLFVRRDSTHSPALTPQPPAGTPSQLHPPHLHTSFDKPRSPSLTPSARQESMERVRRDSAMRDNAANARRSQWRRSVSAYDPTKVGHDTALTILQAQAIVAALLEPNEMTLSDVRVKMQLQKLANLLSNIHEPVHSRAYQLQQEFTNNLQQRRASMKRPGDVAALDWVDVQISDVKKASPKSRMKGQMRPTFLSLLRQNTLNEEGVGVAVPEINEMLLFPHLQKELLKIRSWTDFDVFEVAKYSGNRPLSAVMFHLFTRLDLFQRFSIPMEPFAKFITACEDGYKHNPYHNKIHAADVVQNTFFFLQSDSLAAQVTETEVCATLIAAALHDFAHPGTTNSFHVNTQTDLALRYNDISVLENMHCAESFLMMQQPDKNFLAGMPPEQRREFRQLIISMVLATDMSSHVKNLAHLTATLDAREADQAKHLQEQVDEHAPAEVLAWRHLKIKDPKDRLLASETALHCADLGNPCKAFPLYSRWTELLMEEFHAQGDQEKALGLPVIADRDHPNLARSQLGFLDIVVKPLYSTFQRFVPEVEVCLLELARNHTHWHQEVKQEEAEERAKEGGKASPDPGSANTPPPDAVPPMQLEPS
jgi:hypothetical protein